ncbi:MAG: substrate-binding domain-containing protein [Blautia sp.]|nr:substrate-binding domain-containing protein [Blautia sp.]
MKKKVLAALLCAAMVGSMVSAPVFAENLSDTTEGIAQFDGLVANDAYDFQIVVKSFQSTYWQAALQGMDQASEELGVTYTAQGPASESDIADQVNMLNSAINGAPAGVGLAACDTSSVLESLQAAADAGVPIVAFDTGIADAPEGSVVCTVVTDNTAAGEVAAVNMYEAIKDQLGNGTVRIGEVNQDNYALNIQQRGLGFINKMIELAAADGYTVAMEGNEFYVNAAEGAVEGDADIILEVRVPAQTTVDLCSTEAGTLLDKEDTIAVFGSNQTAAEGLLVANENREVLGDTVVGVGFDAGTSIKAAVEDGTFLGAVTQSPLMMGYYCIYALTAAANGQELIDVPTDGYWYDATNMTDENIAPNLYD